jgi:hypothetical protein
VASRAFLPSFISSYLQNKAGRPGGEEEQIESRSLTVEGELPIELVTRGAGKMLALVGQLGLVPLIFLMCVCCNRPFDRFLLMPSEPCREYC